MIFALFGEFNPAIAAIGPFFTTENTEKNLFGLLCDLCALGGELLLPG